MNLTAGKVVSKKRTLVKSRVFIIRPTSIKAFIIKKLKNIKYPIRTTMVKTHSFSKYNINSLGF